MRKKYMTVKGIVSFNGASKSSKKGENILALFCYPKREGTNTKKRCFLDSLLQ